MAFSERVRRLLLEAVVTASRKTGPFAPTGAGELTGHWTRHEKYDMKTFPQLALTFGTGSPNWVPQLPRTGDCFKRVGPLCEKASGTCVAKSINLHTLVKQCQTQVGGRIHRAFAAGQVYAWPILQALGVGFYRFNRVQRAWKTTWR